MSRKRELAGDVDQGDAMEEYEETYEETDDLQLGNDEEEEADDNEENINIARSGLDINTERNNVLATIDPKIGKMNAKAVNQLIEHFGRLVSWKPSPESFPDNKGKYREEDKIYTKLVKASTSVIKVLGVMKDYENFDTRPLTLFVCRQKWVNTQLRPLMELCSKDDSVTAVRCCKLAIFLTRSMTKEATEALNVGKKSRKLLLSEEESGMAEEENATQEQSNERQKEKNKLSSQEIMRQQLLLQNAKDQLAAFLSFKDAFCTENCVKSIINAFHVAWTKESSLSADDKNRKVDKGQESESKKELGICIAYFRRLLGIESHPEFSSPAAIVSSMRVHYNYIIHLRPLLLVLSAICASILSPYHDFWLRDIILLISSILRDFEGRDMFRVWRENGLISSTDLSDKIEDDDFIDFDEKPILPEIVIPSKIAEKAKTTIGNQHSKILSKSLQQERNSRLNMSIDGRGSRFKSVYVKVPSATSNVSNKGVTFGQEKSTTSDLGFDSNDNNPPKTAEPTNQGISNPLKSSMKIVRNILQPVQQIDTSHIKRNKKHLTFAKVNPTFEQSSSKTLSSDEGQKALVVSATLLDMLVKYDEDDITSYPGIRQLIIRVNEDRRRDEMMIGNDLELHFFQIVSKALTYNRLKLSELRRRFEHDKTVGKTVTTVWEPQVKNIINALDKMSLNRVTSAIVRLRDMEKNYKDLAIPVELYKEQICNFRVLLESDNEAHNDIALAGIFRIFYTTSERLDELPKLLSSFKPGYYDKKYLFVIVELVHETIKTLETARNRYDTLIQDDVKQRLAQSTGKVKKHKGKEIDYEIYVSSCLGFDVKEYVKRLATNQTVLLYTKLLQEYKSLEATTVHYIFCFLQRLCSFQLEQSYPTPLPVSMMQSSQGRDGVDREAATSNNLTLMYLLFNYRTLNAFNSILQDPKIDSMSHMAQLVRLIKSVVRQFGIAAEKNHLLYVEMLFTHINPHNFCQSIDNVYEAVTYRTSSAYHLDSTKKKSKNDKSTSNSAVNDNMDTDREDANDSPQKNDSSDSSHSEGEEEFDDNVVFANGDENDQKSIRKTARQSNRSSDGSKRKSGNATPRKRNIPWTSEEDDALRQLYDIYAGTRSIFTVIAESAALRDFGNNRSVKHVEKRVRELNLHMTVADKDMLVDDDLSNIIDDGASLNSLQLDGLIQKKETPKVSLFGSSPMTSPDQVNSSSEGSPANDISPEKGISSTGKLQDDNFMEKMNEIFQSPFSFNDANKSSSRLKKGKNTRSKSSVELESSDDENIFMEEKVTTKKYSNLVLEDSDDDL